uniref:Protein TsetseEP domain-containing protein n=1 Tax=Anopheles farauti TaxID=69004 RepID=A0A182Q312_9DIPT
MEVCCLRTTALLLLLVGGFCYGAGDFGLPYSVRGFDANFRGGIGSGVVAVVKANASLLKYEAHLDRSGATTALFGVATTLTTPLNKLFGHVAAAFGVNGTVALQKLVDEFEATVPLTAAALEQAATEIRSLVGKVKPNAVESLSANVSTIRTELDTLARNWSPFAEALRTAGAPDSTYDASSISTLITPTMVQSVTTPILLINSALADISDVYGTIGKDRTNAIGYETATNTSIENARQDLSGSVAQVNRTFTETGRQMEQQTNGIVRQVRDGYGQILGRLSSATAASNAASVNAFLTTVDTQTQEHNNRTGKLMQDLASNYTRSVETAADALDERLVAATTALIDDATGSDSVNADRCLQRYVGEFRQGSFATTRLAVCYQVDSRTVNYFSSANSAFVEQLRNGALYGNQAQSVCTQVPSVCADEYVAQLEGIGARNRARLNAFVEFLQEEMAALSERYDLCTRAIRADIDHLVELTTEKYRNCLQTGR